ncbi:putative oxidoreductase [Amantichitinum ursilacus]|uniref:Putative oxidoreductase n=2 Tax=Amantichitinum ursilacus TaxID=857265 RepID=A0A0N0XKK7_9NEIS|nr:putative oxidoreductase [Amantichitinum ursilacus]
MIYPELPFMPTDLDGKVVVITGGGGTLCAELGGALARCGAKVALLDLDLKAAETAAANICGENCDVIGLFADVLDEKTLLAAAERVKNEFGPCDLLINGVGGNHPRGTTTHDFLEKADLGDPEITTFFDLDTGGIDYVFKLNFLGVLMPTQIFARQMMGREGCSVINISSMNATRPYTRIPAYSAAKAAVSNLTQWLAVHFSRTGIRVNALAPGFLLTSQNFNLMIDQTSGHTTERAARILTQTPMQRFGEPKELVGPLLWLASAAASGYVNGAVIPVDGGFQAYAGV